MPVTISTMVATLDKSALPGGRAETAPRRPDSTAAEFRLGLGLYVLWILLAGLDLSVGNASLAQHATVVLLVGVAATNAMFLIISRSNRLHRPPDMTISVAQCVMGITWVTLFAFMSSGTGEVVLGMYVTCILFAANRVRAGSLAQLALYAVAGYAVVLAVKTLFTTPNGPAWPRLLDAFVLGGVLGLLVLQSYRRGNAAAEAAESRPGELAATESPAAPSGLVRAVNRRVTLDSLMREKGRTDRSNNPFTICVFDVDRIDELASEHGIESAELILRRFAKRARGELRAMDGINPGGSDRAFDTTGNEQFVVILPQTRLAGGTRCAERIRTAVAKYPIDGSYDVTVSAGVVEYRRGETVAELLQRAELALGRAQDAGGNRVFGDELAERPQANVIPLRGTHR